MRHLRLVPSTEPETVMRVRIAFASGDRRRVDQHFGAAEAFAIYELVDDEARLVEAVHFQEGDTAMDGLVGSHEGKLAGKIALLAGCVAVYCNAVGASAIKQLLGAGIQPMKVEEGAQIDVLLGDLRASLASSPPPWLAKHLTVRDGGRFDAMEAEGWAE